MGLIYTGEDEERERDKYGRPCLSVWVNGVHFMLVTVKSTTRAPSMADLIQVELLRYGERERDTCSLFGA
jgi:hypothetical protein